MRNSKGQFVKGHKSDNGFKKGQPSLRKGLPAPWAKNNPQTFKKGHIPWSKSHKGIHLSPKTEFKKGVSVSPATQFKKGQSSWNKGKKLPERSGKNNNMWKGGLIKKQCVICDAPFEVYPYREKTKVTCSVKCVGVWQSKVRTGVNSAHWKNGATTINQRIRSSKEYKLWRKAVLERDNATCVWCGSTEKLEVDHIKPFAHFPELRFAIDNGRTLCETCHRTTDTFAGRVQK